MPTWPAKYALTDEEATRTDKVSLEDKKRQVGSVVFSAEMLNQPIDRETAVFKREWFRYKAFEVIENKKTRSFLTIDTKGRGEVRRHRQYRPDTQFRGHRQQLALHGVPALLRCSSTFERKQHAPCLGTDGTRPPAVRCRKEAPMSVTREIIRALALAACAAASFVFVQIYFTAKEELAQETASSLPTHTSAVLADNGDLSKPLSPIFPATPAKSLLNVSPHERSVRKPAKTIVAARRIKPTVRLASRPATHLPMQLIASNHNEPSSVAYGYASEPTPRAAGIFGIIH